MKHTSVLFLTSLLLALQAHADVTLDIAGGDSALATNVRARLSLADEPCEAPEWRVRRLFNRAEKDIEPALRAFGYYRAKIGKQLETGGECWHATVTIDPGERVTVRRRTVTVDGEAATDEELPALLAALPLAEGTPLNHALYEDIKARLRNFAATRGYLDFELTRQELRIFPDEAAAEIAIEAQSGVRYRFGELRLGQTPLDDDFLRRLARVREGDPYDAQALTALDRRLTDTRYFNRVEVRPRRDEAEDDRVPVDVALEAAKRHAWRTGIGFATDTGPRLSLDYENRYINPQGHRFESELRLSPVESTLTGDYLFPGREPWRETFSVGGRLLHEDNDSATSDSAALIAKQTLKSPRLTQSRFIELLHERSTVGEDDVTATLLMPGIRFERLKADDPLRTRRGYRANVELRGAHDALLSTATLLQLRGTAKGIYRFGEGGRISSRVEFGTTWGDSISNLPASIRFFAGGDNSVRGYAYKSLGPTDADDEPLGGRHLLTGSLEYEHPVFKDDWWLAGFVDAGNAFDSSEFDTKVGYGVGVRWYSPVGRVRLDLAFPDDTEDDQWRVHFGLGADL